MPRRLTTLLAAAGFALLGVLGVASPAAAVTPAQKLAVLTSWTQTSAASYSTWNAARINQARLGRLRASTGPPTTARRSPDNPLGFDFELSCYRHDFGYRNYKAIGQFPANKSRLDSAFYEDLKRSCATYNVVVRPACLSLAWTYYQAVRIFGKVVVSQADLDRAAKMKSDAERAAACAR